MTSFLEWRSDISLEQVFAHVDSFAYPQLIDTDSADLLYVSPLKKEKGRLVLMRRKEMQTDCIIPSPFSLRTKVNEYGGKPYWLFTSDIIFANQADQCLYQISLEGDKVAKPRRLTPSSDGRKLSMYTDVSRIDDKHYIAILESEDLLDSSQSNSMCIASLSGQGRELEVSALILGADFYSNLVLSPDAKRVAWVQWNHPNMPWDRTELWTAEISLEGGDINLVNASRITLNEGASVCQLIFSAQGDLFFSADYPLEKDASDYWNIHCYDFSNGNLRRITDLALELGYPHWVYGDHRIARLTPTKLLAVASAPERDYLYLIDTETLAAEELNLSSSESCAFQHLASLGDGRVTGVQLSTDSPPQLAIAELSDGRLLYQNAPPSVTPATRPSIAEHLQFTTRDDAKAYGFFYPPTNPAYTAEVEAVEKPPLIVMVHGGPTARAYGYFDIQKQFWTSRGFALFDVNHRGSSGYGRNYRDALYGHWGEIDTSDIIDGVEMLIRAGKVDRDKVCIRGKSAGGYAVLRALTEYPEYFKAGACYYGIGNLVTLADATHKFEKHYTDRLIGESYNAESATHQSSLFQQRSPIHKIDQLKSAMIVFQGLLDKVVPPSVAREVIDVLKNANVEHAYVEYHDEGHGFRQVDNNIDALSKELEFYRRVLRSSLL